MPNRKKFLSQNILASLCLLFLLAVPFQAAAQRSITGRVVDSSGQVISQATVSLYRSSTLFDRVTTAADGRFEFPELLPGAYLLECAAEGFQNWSGRVALGDGSENMELRLAVAGIHQKITVIASEQPELPLEVGKAVSLVSRDEIARQGARTLGEALQMIPALQSQQVGGPGTVLTHRFRGLRATDTAILLDGFRFRDPSEERGSARSLVADLLVTDAERVEVLRGAGSALYGTSAIGGVVNVISRQPSEPLTTSLNFAGGSLGLLEGGGEVGGQALGQSLSYFVRADHRNYTRGIDGNDASRNNSGSAMLSYRVNSGTQLLARFRATDAFVALNESPSPLPTLPALPAGEFVREAIPFPEPGATFYTQFDDPDYHQRNRFFAGMFRLDQQVSERWVHSAGFQGLLTGRRYDDGPGVSLLASQLGYQDGLATDRQFYDGSTQQAFWRNSIQVNGSNSAHVSVEFDRETLDQDAFGLRTEASQKSLALAARNQTRLLAGRLQLQLAAQAQWYDLAIPRFSDDTRNPFGSLDAVEAPAAYNADVSLAYFFAASATKVRAHAGNGYRAPSLFERFGSGGTGVFRSYFGDPRLRPERSAFIDGGLDQFFFRDRLRASATYFYTHLQTIIDFGAFENDPFGRTFGYVNRKGGSARGVEFDFSARPAGFLEVNGSYTLTKSNQTTPTSAGTTRVLGLSNHQFTVGLAVNPVPRIRLILLATGASDYDFPVFGLTFAIPSSTYRFPGYAKLDLAGTYVVHQSEGTRLEWVTRVDNILNREYYHGGFVVPKATVRSGVRWEF